MKIVATAPMVIPCSRRLRDSPRRIRGACMGFAFQYEEAAQHARAHRRLTEPDAPRPHLIIYLDTPIELRLSTIAHFTSRITCWPGRQSDAAAKTIISTQADRLPGTNFIAIYPPLMQPCCGKTSNSLRRPWLAIV